MNKNTRLSAEERRFSILAGAVPLFAKNGFNGTTTRQIALAANVSEALLYRHFPSKEAIYAELKDFCCQGKAIVSEKIAQLTPSTSTLVHAVYYLITAIFLGDAESHKTGVDHKHMHRLMANSYLEDGEFARIFLEENVKVWEPIFRQCAEAAVRSGDMLEDWVPLTCRWWFAHHIAVSLGLFHLPKKSVIKYGVPKENLLDAAVRFALRGMGLKDEAIKTYYNPEALALFAFNMEREV